MVIMGTVLSTLPVLIHLIFTLTILPKIKQQRNTKYLAQSHMIYKWQTRHSKLRVLYIARLLQMATLSVRKALPVFNSRYHVVIIYFYSQQ